MTHQLPSDVVAAGPARQVPASTAPGRRRWVRLLPHIAWLAFFYPLAWSDYNITQMTAIVVLVIVAVGYNLIVGYSGQFVVFSAAMVGIGAYTMAYLLTHAWSWELAALAATVMTGAIGYVVGALTTRFRGVYLALVSVGLAEAVTIVLANWSSVTGGETGLAVPNISLGGSSPPSATTLYVVTVALAAVSILIYWRLTSSQWGRNLRALSFHPIAATSAGINVSAAKRTAVGIGGMFWGLAGALSALSAGYLSPDDYGLSVSTTHLAMIVIGGLGTFAGPILGAVALGGLSDIVKFSGGLATLIYAAILYFVVLFVPGGMTDGITRLGRAIGRHLGLSSDIEPPEPPLGEGLLDHHDPVDSATATGAL
jgi:branched-chain amino acid transport system permease protein